MTGSVLARLSSSETAAAPSAAPSAAVRRKPVTRLTMLPRAMMALFRATEPVISGAASVSAGAARGAGGGAATGGPDGAAGPGGTGGSTTVGLASYPMTPAAPGTTGSTAVGSSSAYLPPRYTVPPLMASDPIWRGPFPRQSIGCPSNVYFERQPRADRRPAPRRDRAAAGLPRGGRAGAPVRRGRARAAPGRRHGPRRVARPAR